MVTMSHKTAGNAAMFAHGEGFTDSVTALGAVLGSELRRDLHDLSASILSFARQDLKEGIPRRVTDGLCQMMIPDQTANVQNNAKFIPAAQAGGFLWLFL